MRQYCQCRIITLICHMESDPKISSLAFIRLDREFHSVPNPVFDWKHIPPSWQTPVCVLITCGMNNSDLSFPTQVAWLRIRFISTYRRGTNRNLKDAAPCGFSTVHIIRKTSVLNSHLSAAVWMQPKSMSKNTRAHTHTKPLFVTHTLLIE